MFTPRHFLDLASRSQTSSVSSTIWEHTRRPEVEWLDRESERQRLGLLDLTVCEVLQGVSNDAAAAHESFRTLRRFEIVDTGPAIASALDNFGVRS